MIEYFPFVLSLSKHDFSFFSTLLDPSFALQGISFLRPTSGDLLKASSASPRLYSCLRL